MTNERILKKTIEKAVKNGFKWLPITKERIEMYLEHNTYYTVIFSHDFAKTFWGPPFTKKEWGYHLQQMVLEPEPLKYLEKFL